MNRKIKEYRLRRAKRMCTRADSDSEEKGRWITTGNDHKVHLNEEGVPDKGNPHVIDLMEKSPPKPIEQKFEPVGSTFQAKYQEKKIKEKLESALAIDDEEKKIYEFANCFTGANEDYRFAVDGAVYKRIYDSSANWWEKKHIQDVSSGEKYNFGEFAKKLMKAKSIKLLGFTSHYYDKPYVVLGDIDDDGKEIEIAKSANIKSESSLKHSEEAVAKSADVKPELGLKHSEVEEAEKGVNINPNFNLKHSEDSFSPERRASATWDQEGGKVADNILRPVVSKVWKKLSPKEKFAAYRYTQDEDKDYGYADMGKMLREDAPDWWSDYDREQVKSNIDNLTSAIDKCDAPQDMWLQRGCSVHSLMRLFNVSGDPKTFEQNSPEDILSLISTSADYGQDKAFLSCGSAEGKGTNQAPVIMKIYCPKGTKMMYMEPFSALGYGFKKEWDGEKSQEEFSREDETLLQRGTMVVPRKVTKNDNQIFVEVDVIGCSYEGVKL